MNDIDGCYHCFGTLNPSDVRAGYRSFIRCDRCGAMYHSECWSACKVTCLRCGSGQAYLIAANSGQIPRINSTQSTVTRSVAAKTNAWSIASLVASILGWVGLFGIGGLVGIILGIIARQQIKTSRGVETGEGFALAGIIMGGMNVIVTCLVLLCILGWVVITPFINANSR